MGIEHRDDIDLRYDQDLMVHLCIMSWCWCVIDLPWHSGWVWVNRNDKSRIVLCYIQGSLITSARESDMKKSINCCTVGNLKTLGISKPRQNISNCGLNKYKLAFWSWNSKTSQERGFFVATCQAHWLCWSSAPSVESSWRHRWGEQQGRWCRRRGRRSGAAPRPPTS